MENTASGYNSIMPPPKKPAKDKRADFVKVYLTGTEKARLVKLAAAQGLSLAAYVRMVLLNVANVPDQGEAKK